MWLELCSVKSINVDFLNQIRYFQSSSYPIVLMRLSGPRSRPNPHLKLLICQEKLTMINYLKISVIKKLTPLLMEPRRSKRVIRVRPDNADKWMLHHDNAQCHIALSVTECLTSKGIPVVPQPPCNWPQPSDFFLFPNIKNLIKGRHFGTLENIQKSVTDMMKPIPVEDFQRCYQKWEKHLHRYVAAQWNYFGEDKKDVWKK